MTPWFDRAAPRLYDMGQRLLGMRHSQRHLEPYCANLAGRVVLDVGAGTGLYASLVPRTARYCGLDIDANKLLHLRRNVVFCRVVLADSASLCFRDRSVDVALCIALAHHLPDERLGHLFAELARVVRDRVVFLDPLASPSVVSRLLWRLDRGAYPRSAERLLTEIGRHFTLRRVERYRIHHEYLLCEGQAKG